MDKNSNWAEESIKNSCASSQGGEGHSRVGNEASIHSREKIAENPPAVPWSLGLMRANARPPSTLRLQS